MIGHAQEFNSAFNCFNGNIKYSRTHLSPSGLDGFLYNGNMTIMHLNSDLEVPVYLINKCTQFYCSDNLLKAKKNGLELSKK
jgi:hypothetical protein